VGGKFTDFIMWAMRSLLGWLYWEEACLTWFGSGYILSRLNVSMVIVLVYSIANSTVHNTALKMFGHP
jgi:hypothetical protein